MVFIDSVNSQIQKHRKLVSKSESEITSVRLYCASKTRLFLYFVGLSESGDRFCKASSKRIIRNNNNNVDVECGRHSHGSFLCVARNRLACLNSFVRFLCIISRHQIQNAVDDADYLSEREDQIKLHPLIKLIEWSHRSSTSRFRVLTEAAINGL